MAEPTRPTVYSIAAHRGFADALVAGIAPRFFEDGFGLARLTMLLPSTRAVRTITEAFIRNAGETGRDGLLLPRMVVAGALDLDEALGALLDPLGAADIPPAADPTRRLLRLAELLRVELGADAPPAPALLRLARDIAAVMDRLLVEDIAPEALLSDTVLDRLENLADHWRGNIRLFAAIQARWLAELDARGEVDAATRRNRRCGHAPAIPSEAVAKPNGHRPRGGAAMASARDRRRRARTQPCDFLAVPASASQQGVGRSARRQAPLRRGAGYGKRRAGGRGAGRRAAGA